jgi:hypothetical protein
MYLFMIIHYQLQPLCLNIVIRIYLNYSEDYLQIVCLYVLFVVYMCYV